MEAGGRIVLGKAFESSEMVLSHLKEEKEEESRKKDLLAFEEDFIASEETKETIHAALDILKRRRIVSVQGHDAVINVAKADYLEFYANSLKHLLE
jgi:environmental stress-induced protein Ves